MKTIQSEIYFGRPIIEMWETFKAVAIAILDWLTSEPVLFSWGPRPPTMPPSIPPPSLPPKRGGIILGVAPQWEALPDAPVEWKCSYCQGVNLWKRTTCGNCAAVREKARG